jgi:alpha-galactosidase
LILPFLLTVSVSYLISSHFLSKDESFATPEAILVRSNEGLGGMSRTFHRLFLERLIPSNWSDINPPILINTWEAKYFHVNHNNILEMTEKARKVGIDLIVLDDGWFAKRYDGTKSLGDWVINVEKFPNGLKSLVDEINHIGCKFGLWWEPEMVSEESVRNQPFRFVCFLSFILSCCLVFRLYIQLIVIGIFMFQEDHAN